MLTLAADPIASAQRMVEAAARRAMPDPCGSSSVIVSALCSGVGRIAQMTRQEIRGAILATQDHLMALPGAQLECPVKHHFAPGSYAREMTIPAGVIIIGKIHRHAHINVISKGRVRVVTEAGLEVFEAPHTFVSEQGTKRAVFAETETVWTTVHVTDDTDLDKIEESVIACSYEDLGVIDAVPLQEKLQ